MHSALATGSVASNDTRPEVCAEEPPPKSQPRVRLEVDARRAQLLQLGRELFTTRRYDDLSIGEIARVAGISKGLLYHYFPSKRVFYVESVREAAGELLRHAMPSGDLGSIERLRAAIDVYLGYVDRHKTVFSALIWRGILDDPEVTRIVENTRLRFFDRLFSEIAETPIGRNALRGWIGFIEASVLDWIERPDLTQRELSDLFVAVFQQIVARQANGS
jgi:AcrR family transcriptional regulator